MPPTQDFRPVGIQFLSSFPTISPHESFFLLSKLSFSQAALTHILYLVRSLVVINSSAKRKGALGHKKNQGFPFVKGFPLLSSGVLYQVRIQRQTKENPIAKFSQKLGFFLFKKRFSLYFLCAASLLYPFILRETPHSQPSIPRSEISKLNRNRFPSLTAPFNNPKT